MFQWRISSYPVFLGRSSRCHIIPFSKSKVVHTLTASVWEKESDRKSQKLDWDKKKINQSPSKPYQKCDRCGMVVGGRYIFLTCQNVMTWSSPRSSPEFLHSGEAEHVAHTCVTTFRTELLVSYWWHIFFNNFERANARVSTCSLIDSFCSSVLLFSLMCIYNNLFLWTLSLSLCLLLLLCASLSLSPSLSLSLPLSCCVLGVSRP